MPQSCGLVVSFYHSGGILHSNKESSSESAMNSANNVELVSLVPA